MLHISLATPTSISQQNVSADSGGRQTSNPPAHEIKKTTITLVMLLVVCLTTNDKRAIVIPKDLHILI